MQRDNLYTIVLNKNNSHKGSADKVLIMGLNKECECQEENTPNCEDAFISKSGNRASWPSGA